MSLVHEIGPLNWVRIAQTLGSRSPKQCRERYHQNLKPTLNHEPITPDEGRLIEELVRQIGKRWAEIARRLHGRSDNAVKNWWNGSQNRRIRSDRRRATHGNEDYYSANRHGLSISTTPSHHIPGAQLSPMQGPMMRHTGGSWIEAPLPSPCSSDGAESETGSNYTTSPAYRPASLSRAVELPPLRGHYSSHGDPRLPSINAAPLASYEDRPRTERGEYRQAFPYYGERPPTERGEYKPAYPSPHGIPGQRQLPTAPSSPVQQQSYPQFQAQPRSEQAYPQSQEQPRSEQAYPQSQEQPRSEQAYPQSQEQPRSEQAYPQSQAQPRSEQDSPQSQAQPRSKQDSRMRLHSLLD
jgi:Myb-like DNA-binding protein FlbD